MVERIKPVFIDQSGRRWRRIRRAALLLGVATTLIAAGVVVSELFFPPIPPELALATGNGKASERAKLPTPYTKIDRLRIAYRRKLMETMKRYGNPTSRRPEMVPVLNVGTGTRPTRTDAI